MAAVCKTGTYGDLLSLRGPHINYHSVHTKIRFTLHYYDPYLILIPHYFWTQVLTLNCHSFWRDVTHLSHEDTRSPYDWRALYQTKQTDTSTAERRGLYRNRRWEGDPASGSLSHHRSAWRQMTGRHDPLTLCPCRRFVPQHVSAGQIWPNIHYLNDRSQTELWHTFTFNIILIHGSLRRLLRMSAIILVFV